MLQAEMVWTEDIAEQTLKPFGSLRPALLSRLSHNLRVHVSAASSQQYRELAEYIGLASFIGSSVLHSNEIDAMRQVRILYYFTMVAQQPRVG